MARPRPIPRTPYCIQAVGRGPAILPLLVLLLVLPLVLPAGCLGRAAEPAPAEAPRIAPDRGAFYAGVPVPFEVASPVEGEVRWEYGDGANGTGKRAPHTYREPGVYAVTVHAGGATATFLVPVHWRHPIDAALDTPPPGEEAAALEQRAPLWDAAARSSARLEVRADPLAAFGTSVTLTATNPAGDVLANTRTVLAAGENDTLVLDIPVDVLAPADPWLLYRIEVEGGQVSLVGSLEVRSRDPR